MNLSELSTKRQKEYLEMAKDTKNQALIQKMKNQALIQERMKATRSSSGTVVKVEEQTHTSFAKSKSKKEKKEQDRTHKRYKSRSPSKTRLNGHKENRIPSHKYPVPPPNTPKDNSKSS